MRKSHSQANPFREHSRTKSFFRFALVGVSNTFVDFAVFTILREIFDVNYLWCQAAGYTFGTFNSFVLNKKWTFASKTSHIQTSIQLFQFICVNLISMGVSLLGLRMLSGYWYLNVYVAKVVVTALAQLINYSGYRFWVFSDKKVVLQEKNLS